MPERIYLDNNSSTPLDPIVSAYIVEMLPKLIGNPSSTHAYGRNIKSLITKSKDTIAEFLGVKTKELVFTSCGTESINIALNGIAGVKPKGHIITSVAEHACVIAVCKQLESVGHPVTYLPPGEVGAVAVDAVKAAIRPDTCMIALMAVNNETGVKTDISAIAAVAHAHGIPFVVDAVAQLGKEVVDIPVGVSAMAFSGHKVHALQGVGLLFVRVGTKLKPVIVGGEQELGRRAGTENVIGILSLGKAIEQLLDRPEKYYVKMADLRDSFESYLMEHLDNVVVNGMGSRISNVSNLSFGGVDGETLLMLLDKAGIAASHGSACSSGALEPSRVLTSMGLDVERVRSSIRFSFSRFNTHEEVEEACERIVRTITTLRTPNWCP